MNTKKKVLLASPISFNLYELIVENLEFLGYEVIHIEETGYVFKYRSIWERLNNFYRKTFLKDKDFKLALRKQSNTYAQLDIIKQHAHFDFALVLRADFFKHEVLAAISERADLTLSFHYDGVSRDLAVLDTVQFFDRFYVFDEGDVARFPEHNFLYAPNFYFDYPIAEASLSDSAPADVYYVSSFHASRADELIALHRFLLQQYAHVTFVIVCIRSALHLVPAYMRENMIVQHEYVSFKDQFSFVSRADVIIDLVIADHAGYSFRVFEGLRLRKKVITSNEQVVKADFYHPNNFFVFNGTNFDDLEAFLKTAYVDISVETVEKYAFTNWLNAKLLKTV